MVRSASWGSSSPSISEEISWVMSCSCPIRPGSRSGHFLWGLRPRYIVVTRVCLLLLLLPPLVLARPQLRAQLLGHRLPRAEDSRSNRADRATHDLRDLLVRQPVQLAQR